VVFEDASLFGINRKMMIQQEKRKTDQNIGINSKMSPKPVGINRKMCHLTRKKSQFTKNTKSISIYDSITVFEKSPQGKKLAIRTGNIDLLKNPSILY
jgi:hypothetical protein